ncbi:unnamed protein product [Calypogeia fissa]
MNPRLPTGEHSRDRNFHQCKPVGEGRPMYRFNVQVKGEVMVVWEKAGDRATVWHEQSGISRAVSATRKKARALLENHGRTVGGHIQQELSSGEAIQQSSGRV